MLLLKFTWESLHEKTFLIALVGSTSPRCQDLWSGSEFLSIISISILVLLHKHNVLNFLFRCIVRLLNNYLTITYCQVTSRCPRRTDPYGAGSPAQVCPISCTWRELIRFLVPVVCFFVLIYFYTVFVTLGFILFYSWAPVEERRK